MINFSFLTNFLFINQTFTICPVLLTPISCIIHAQLGTEVELFCLCGGYLKWRTGTVGLLTAQSHSPVWASTPRGQESELISAPRKMCLALHTLGGERFTSAHFRKLSILLCAAGRRAPCRLFFISFNLHFSSTL